jgi:hypothetical protein
MALSQSVLSELLEAFRAGEGVDLVRESVRLVMQELIETGATEHIGAGRYEPSESRMTDRNGLGHGWSRPRPVTCSGGSRSYGAAAAVVDVACGRPRRVVDDGACGVLDGRSRPPPGWSP